MESKIIDGKKFIEGKVGSIRYFIDSVNRTRFIEIPLLSTPGKIPFGFELIMRVDENGISPHSFGKGTTFSHEMTLTYLKHEERKEYNDCILLQNAFEKVLFIPKKSDDETVIYYVSSQSGTILEPREDDSTFVFYETSGATTIFKEIERKTDYKSDIVVTLEIERFENKQGQIFYRHPLTNLDTQLLFIDETENEKPFYFEFYRESRYANYTSVFIKRAAKQNSNGYPTVDELVYQIDFTYDNEYLSSISYKENGVEFEKYTFTRSDRTIAIYDERKEQKVILDYVDGNEMSILQYMQDQFLGKATLISDGKSRYYIDPNGKKIQYLYTYIHTYRDQVSLSSELDQEGWFKTYTFDGYNRLVEESNPIFLFAKKENLLTNDDFSSDEEGYEISGHYQIEEGTSLFPSILEKKLRGKWLNLDPSSDEKVTVSRRISKKGIKGDQYTFYVALYIKTFSDIHQDVSLKVRFYNENGNVIQNKTSTKELVEDVFACLSFSFEAEDNYAYFDVIFECYSGESLYLKNIGVYEIPIGTQIQYGFGGKVLYQKNGHEGTYQSYDEAGRIIGLFNSSIGADLVTKYDYRNLPILSEDIYGNETKKLYGEGNEVVYQHTKIKDGDGELYYVESKEVTYYPQDELTKITKEQDSRNEITTTTDSLVLKKTLAYQDPIGKQKLYTYSAYHFLSKVEEKDDKGTSLRNVRIEYGDHDEITSLRRNDTNAYLFFYNKYGLLSRVQLSSMSSILENYQYLNENNENEPKSTIVTRKILEDGRYTEYYNVDSEGKIYNISYRNKEDDNSTELYSFMYDAKGRLESTYYLDELEREYIYDAKDDIRSILIYHGERIDFHDKQNGENYIITRTSPLGKKSHEWSAYYNRTMTYAPGTLKKGVFQEFYCTFLDEVNESTSKANASLRKSLFDGQVVYRENASGKEVSVEKDDILSCYRVKEDKNYLKYIMKYVEFKDEERTNLERESMDYFASCLFSLDKESLDSEKSASILTLYGDKYHALTIEQKGSSVSFQYIDYQNSTVNVIHEEENFFQDETWHFLGIRTFVNEKEGIVFFYAYFDDKKAYIMFPYDYKVDGTPHLPASDTPVLWIGKVQEVPKKSIDGALGKYTGFTFQHGKLEEDTVDLLKEAVQHHILDIIQNRKQWKQEAYGSKSFYLSLDKVGFEQYDFLPLSGDFTSIKGDKDVDVEAVVPFQKWKDLFLWDDEKKEYVLNSSKISFAKTLVLPTNKKRIISFDFKIDSDAVPLLTIFASPYLKVNAHILSNTIKVYYEIQGKEYETPITFDILKWQKLTLRLIRNGEKEKVNLKIGDTHYTFESSLLFEENVKIGLGGLFHISIMNLLYGYGENINLTYDDNTIRVKEDFIFDTLGRTKSSTMYLNGIDTYTRTYSYIMESGQIYDNKGKKVEVKTTTPYVEYEVQNVGNEIIQYDYSYDHVGRLSSWSSKSQGQTYDYNAYGYLEKETNQDQSSLTYFYDSNGNITKVEKCLSPYDDEEEDDPITTVFTYSTTYKDRLEKAGLEVIRYDGSQFYPAFTYHQITGKSLFTFTWLGNRLSHLKVYPNTEIDYEYNENGTRRKKVVKVTELGVTKTDEIYYSYVGNQLQSEKHSDYELQFFYGQDNKPLFFIYRSNNGEEYKYFYQWNMLGITGIFEEQGFLVAEYTYDAYGNVLKIGGLVPNIGVINPLLYRGNYYDHESKLYYMDGRYYNPNWRRFIQPASLSTLNPNSLDSLNLYVYAYNTPIAIMYSGVKSSNAFEQTISTVGLYGPVLKRESIKEVEVPREEVPNIPPYVHDIVNSLDALSNYSEPSLRIFKLVLYKMAKKPLKNIVSLNVSRAFSLTMDGLGWTIIIVGGIITAYERYAAGGSIENAIKDGLFDIAFSVGTLLVGKLVSKVIIYALIAKEVIAPTSNIVPILGPLIVQGITMKIIIIYWLIKRNHKTSTTSEYFEYRYEAIYSI